MVTHFSLDPSNRRALEGLHRIDNSSSKIDTTYYITVGEEEGGETNYERMPDSENEVNFKSFFKNIMYIIIAV